MTKTTIRRKLYYGRVIDEKALRRFEEIFKSVNADAFEINATFSNKYRVECNSVDELLKVPSTDAYRITDLKMRTRDLPLGDAGNEPTYVEVDISTDPVMSEFKIDVTAEYHTCVGLERQLLDVARSTLSLGRSVFHPRFFLDIVLVYFLISAFAAAALKVWGLADVTGSMYLVFQVGVAGLYLTLKTYFLPGILLKVGRGEKVANWHTQAFVFLLGITIVTVFTSILGEYAVRSWFNSNGPVN